MKIRNILFLTSLFCTLKVFGAAINPKSTNYELLIEAAREGSLEDIKKFEQAGADLKKWIWYDRQGQTLLHLVAFHGDPKILDYLISKGLDLNLWSDYGLSPLHWAIVGARGIHGIEREKQIQKIKSLIKAGATLDKKDYSGNTAYDIAIEKNDMDIANLVNNLRKS